MPELEKIEVLTESLKNYASTNCELIKLKAADYASEFGAGLISGLIIGLAGILFVFFLSLGIGFYISYQMGNDYSGFAIVAGFYFLLGLILILGRKKLMEKPLQDKIIQKILIKN
jgi:uncharacterized membrane protein